MARLIARLGLSGVAAGWRPDVPEPHPQGSTEQAAEKVGPLTREATRGVRIEREP